MNAEGQGERQGEPGRTGAGGGGRTLGASWFAAVGAIAATYVYFLIFAEFALLERVRAIAPEAERLRFVMAGLGAGGVAGAGLGAWGYRPERARGLLAWALRACAGAAALAWAAETFAAVAVAAVAVGLSLGWLTVTLSAGLRAATGGARLGLAVGAGTGIAYAFCNVPWLFRAPALTQTAVAAGIVLAASWLPRLMAAGAAEPEREDEFARGGVVRWVVILLALVWMDSAAFYIVQHTEALRAATWGSSTALAGNATVHLLAAIAAGALLDRGGRRAVAAVALLALAVACLMLNGTLTGAGAAAWCYTAGVSLYSTVLVEYPARSGRAGVAAAVFAVAGWVGSALGIGMAQDLATVPLAFVVIAGGTGVLALAWRLRTRGALAVAAAVAVAAPRAPASDTTDPVVAQGREVYIAEGCIHCHSQYVRPRVARDVEQWGPAAALEKTLAVAPPLPGNRRLGPDLAAVGNRRSPEWNRLHLIAPRAVSPGSRMPAYAHLFAGGDGRGDALVAYLGSLGAETREARRAQTAAWMPRAGEELAPAKAQGLFQRLCTPCHGGTGRGDGPLAGRLSYPPPDWTRVPWRHVLPGPDGDRAVALARVIKFGLPGLAMAGHEYLPDGDVMGLVSHVQALHNGRDAGSVAAAPP